MLCTIFYSPLELYQKTQLVNKNRTRAFSMEYHIKTFALSKTNLMHKYTGPPHTSCCYNHIHAWNPYLVLPLSPLFRATFFAEEKSTEDGKVYKLFS